MDFAPNAMHSTRHKLNNAATEMKSLTKTSKLKRVAEDDQRSETIQTGKATVRLP